MTTSYVEVHNTSLFETEAPILIHGCNCFHTMGSGIAKTIRSIYPSVFQADLQTIKGHRAKLGAFSYYKVSDSLTVVNLYSQYTWWNKNDMFYNAAFEKGLTGIILAFPEANDFAMPAIGLGLANGVPYEVFSIIHKVASTHKKTIHLHIIDEHLQRTYAKYLKFET